MPGIVEITEIVLLLAASAAYLLHQFWTRELSVDDAASRDDEPVSVDERKAA